MRIKLNMYESTGGQNNVSTDYWYNASGGASIVYFPGLFDTQGKIHNQILANLPAIKKELSKLQNMEGFETYEGYKEMIEQYPDSFPNSYLKGLNVLDKVEAALQDKRFNASELAAAASYSICVSNISEVN